MLFGSRQRGDTSHAANTAAGETTRPAKPAEPALEGVWLDRGGRTVLREVSAAFRGGQVTAIVGPSGSGKSSVLRCLNRLEEPEQGRVLLDGGDIRDLPPTELRRRVCMVPQTPIVFPGGVLANLEYGMNPSPGRDRLVESLETVGLSSDYLDRSSSELSVGEAQRVCIARALIRDPQVLLLDEPTSALDRDAARRIEQLIASLAQEGLTQVIVTHDLRQAERVAGAAVLIVEGEVAATGAVADAEAAWPASHRKTSGSSGEKAQ